MTGGARIRVAVIGCGAMGTWHAHVISKQPGIEVVGVADALDDPAVALADALGARVGEGHELIEAGDIDAVLIASSDDSHAQYAIKTIEAQKPCFLEKPIGVSLSEAEQILEAELSLGRRLVRVGFMREVDPAHQQVAAALAELGEVTRVRCVHRNVDTSPRKTAELFTQSLIHDIHSIRWLSDQEFLAVMVHVVERSDGFHDLLLVGELNGGSIGTVDFEDRAFAYEVHVEVTATGGMTTTLPHPRAITRSSGVESLRTGTDWFTRFEDAYRIEIEQWTGTLRGESAAVGPSLWDGYAAQVVADAGARSLGESRRVAIDLRPVPDLYLELS